MLSSSICAAIFAFVASVDAAAIDVVKQLPLGPADKNWKDTGIIPKKHILDFAEISRQLNGSNVGAHPFTGSIPSIGGRDVLSARDVLGPDNRFRYNNPNQFPFRAVGKVFLPGAVCSGSLVGPSLVLTAAHCAENNGAMQFCPSYDNGQPNPTFGCANAIDRYVPSRPANGDCHFGRDFAILRLDKRYGDGLGYFGYSRPDQSRFGQQILNTGGYPGDRDGAQNSYFAYGGIAQRLGGCSDYGTLLNDLDAAGGQSGSPIWVDGGYIWSVLAGTTSSYTVGSGDKNAEDAITYLRNAGG